MEIERDVDVVRRQFGDVAHHAATGVHRGVVFEVIEEDDDHCHYRQISTVGPFKLSQEFEFDRGETGPLVNRIVAGPFTGGTVSFTVEPRGQNRCVVEARVTAPASWFLRMVAPLLRPQVGRQLAAALVEDKVDLEDGGYGRSPRERPDR